MAQVWKPKDGFGSLATLEAVPLLRDDQGRTVKFRCQAVDGCRQTVPREWDRRVLETYYERADESVAA